MDGNNAQKGEFPWQVSIIREGKHTCGGTLISLTHVMTAAHCFADAENILEFQVILGEYNMEVVEGKLA